MKAKLTLIAALLMSGALLFAQGGYKGGITVNVVTEDGSALPGAVAELTADTFSRSFVSDANGNVRFVGLVPDVYELRVTFTGFNTYVRPNLIVDSGQNIRLEVPMTPSTQQEELVVTAETPLLDQTKVGTATVLTEEELNAIPQSRDPWSVIMTVPGVQTDRINVGGSEAGQQSNFASKGDDGDNATWVMDGVEFVDPGARGASQTYLDFSSFAQMNVTTGGADTSVRSGGAALNFVTKQGSNNHQGSIRLLYADEAFQSSNNVEIPSSGAILAGNRIAETFEKSFEIGGPIIKDRLWYWGAFSQNSITQLVLGTTEDRTELRNVSFKLHGDITSTTRFNAFYTEGDKIKNGRGAAITRPQNTTWDQAGPTPIYKFELSQLIGQNTELSFIAARVDGGFGLTPQGSDGQISLDLTTGVWANTTFIDYSTRRPVRQYEVKGNTFLSSANMDHELQYGFQYKEASVQSLTTYGDEGVLSLTLGADAVSGVALYREGNAATDLEYTTFSIQDTITYGNWTFKVGLRYDLQEGNNTASTVNANPFAPDVLPTLDFAGAGVPFEWESIAPRLGATYTWGDENQFLVRGSFSQFYETLGSGFITPDNPTIVKNAYYAWNDDGDQIVEQGELGALLASNINSVLNQIDPNLDPPVTDEFLIGAEWAITPEFTVGVTGTIRERDDATWARSLFDVSDFERIESSITNPITGQTVDTSRYVLSSDATVPDANGDGVITSDDVFTTTANRPDYTEDYTGLEFTATKRLSNRWMMRANLVWQNWERNVGPNAVQTPGDFQSGANEDGGAIGIQSAGSGTRGNVFFGSAEWTFNINGLYQLPWDLTVSGNLNAREGFAQPFYQRHTDFDLRGRNIQLIKGGPFDQFKNEDVYVFDFKLTKTFNMGGRTKVEIAAEIFNAFNEDRILARELRMDIGRVNDPVEVLSPRVGRFSATVHF